MVKAFIKGIPYCQQKVRGNTKAPKQWSDTVLAQTKDLPKIKGRCRLRLIFHLPSDKFPKDHPFGPDLDNLVKRFLDAMHKTIFSQTPGKDGSVVELIAKKRKVIDPEKAGVQMEYQEL